MNPSATIVESTYCQVPLSFVLGTGLFSMSEAVENDRCLDLIFYRSLKEARIGEHTPETVEYGITLFTYRALKPLYPQKLDNLSMAMLDKEAPFDKSIILRSKGFSCPRKSILGCY